MQSYFAVVLLSLVTLVAGFWPLPSDLTTWIWQSGALHESLWPVVETSDGVPAAVVVDEWLYIDAGQYYTTGPDIEYPGAHYPTLSHMPHNEQN